MMFRLLLISTAALTFWLAGCGSSEFDGGAIKGILEGSPLNLAGEQVTLTGKQLDCGVQNELWDPPSGNTARLTQKGRDLKFSDDVRVVDPDVREPYTQVTGAFPVSVTDVSKLRDAGAGVKLADVKLGVIIAHECFSAPLPLMGVKKGKFATDAPVVFQFRGSGKEWSLDKLVH